MSVVCFCYTGLSVISTVAVVYLTIRLLVSGQYLLFLCLLISLLHSISCLSCWTRLMSDSTLPLLTFVWWRHTFLFMVRLLSHWPPVTFVIIHIISIWNDLNSVLLFTFYYAVSTCCVLTLWPGKAEKPASPTLTNSRKAEIPACRSLIYSGKDEISAWKFRKNLLQIMLYLWALGLGIPCCLSSGVRGLKRRLLMSYVEACSVMCLCVKDRDIFGLYCSFGQVPIMMPVRTRRLQKETNWVWIYLLPVQSDCCHCTLSSLQGLET